MLFAAPGSTCVYLWLFAVLRLGRAKYLPNDTEAAEVIRFRRASSGVGSTSCLVPPQPVNGRWKLHRRFCDEPDLDCAVPQRVMLATGSQLVYRCNDRYKVDGNADAFCLGTGIWSSIPSCVEIKCRSLSSMSRIMTHWLEYGVEVPDEMPLESKALLNCRIGYVQDETIYGGIMTCSADGTWKPKPLECIQACGVRGMWTETPNRNDSIWHASLYLSSGNRKNFICGATIVRPKILLTSAICVYDEKANATIDPGKLFVMTGNTVTDYDSPLHDPNIVKKAAVKSLRTNHYSGSSADNYTHDIAMLELEEPFALSIDLRPACVDSSDSHDKAELGHYGTIVGLGRTSSNASGHILKNLTLPLTSALDFDLFTTDSTNGSGICGSGFVVQKGDLWYLRGILITSYNENGERTCSGYSNSLLVYTQLYGKLGWVQHMMWELESNDVFVPPVRTTTTTPLTTSTVNPANVGIVASVDDSSCLVPPQPENGKWRIHGYRCENNTECNIPQGTRLKPGSALIYSCSVGYRASGNAEVYCGLEGQWSTIPDCIEVTCEPLKSVSRSAFCSRFGRQVNCEYSVPAGTRAEISCSKGYEKDTVFIPTQRDTLTCTKEGKWKPEPIRCIPVCGVPLTSQTPLAIGGTAAEIGDFPWHATLYRHVRTSKGCSKEFKCGATIIHKKLLLTAAHCVYEESAMHTVDPARLFVMTGNIFRDYDSPAHDSHIVKKRKVKNVHVHMNYFGLDGNYASDIALLELQKPFDISETLLPACLDIDGKSERILQPGAYGKVAGFGRTASAETSGILQTVTLPFVPYDQCRNSNDDSQIKKLINDGKFCAGYTNGTSVCEGDSGGGLVFPKNDVWYVLGIVSVGLGADFSLGVKTCDPHFYTAFTKVSLYMNWIQDVIVNLEQ